MKELSARQSIILMLITIIATKFFVLPVFLAEGMKQNIIIIMTLFVIMEILVIYVLLRASVKNENLTFYDLLQKSFGTIYAKIILILLFVLYLGKNILNINETYAFFLNTLYDNLSPILFIIPFLIMLFFSYVKGLNAIGRTAELLWIFISIGILFSIIIGLLNVDITNLLPILDYPIDKSLNTLQQNIFWFGDFFIFFMFFGNIRFNKGYLKKMMIVVSIGFAILVSFYTLYFCLFPYSSGIQHFAVSDITQFTPSISNFGRIDWITSFIWTSASVLQSIIYYYCATKCLRFIFNCKNELVMNGISLSILLICLYLLNFNLPTTILIAQSPLRFLIPLLIVASFIFTPMHTAIIKRRAMYEKQKYPNFN